MIRKRRSELLLIDEPHAVGNIADDCGREEIALAADARAAADYFRAVLLRVLDQLGDALELRAIVDRSHLGAGFESVADFRVEFEALVNSLDVVKATIVLIDDLDRCLDDTVIDVFEAIRLLRKELEVPLLGFAGAPFTLASYLVEGGPSRTHERTKALMLGEPPTWFALMDALVAIVLPHLRAQAEAGAF